MRQTALIIALALVAGASFNAANAAKKKKKDAPAAQPVVLPVQLSGGSDSLSYAAGMSVTQGLMQFLVQQQGVDTAFMADFIAGFRQVVADGDNPQAKARVAGMQIADQVKARMLPGLTKEFAGSPDSIVDSLFYRGFTDALLGDTTHFSQAAAEQFFKDRQVAAKAAKDEALYGLNRDAGRKYLEDNKTKDGVITTPSGLQYKVLTQGDGEVPQATDKVLVNYEGRLIDGTVFDASSKHGDKPSTFRADQVIKGWTEALTMMPVGSKWQLYIPAELAYGDRHTGNIKPYSTLIFDVELVGIDKPQAEAADAKPAAKGGNARTAAKGKK